MSDASDRSIERGSHAARRNGGAQCGAGVDDAVGAAAAIAKDDDDDGQRSGLHTIRPLQRIRRFVLCGRQQTQSDEADVWQFARRLPPPHPDSADVDTAL